MEEKLGELLFDLSSADRLTLLKAIDREKLRQTQLAARLSATAQETSRHLIRLSHDGLISKDSEGLHSLTPFGIAVLRLMPSIDFLCRHKKYFLSHDVTSLPPSFLERIGELSESAHVERLGGVLDHLQRVIGEAKDFVWLMADQVLTNSLTNSRQTLIERGISMRIIIPTSEFSSPPLSAHELIPQNMEIRFADKVCAGISMNEAMAGVVFPDTNGRIDFSNGFRGSGQGVYGWCRDLFLQHWQQAKTLT